MLILKKLIKDKRTDKNAINDKYSKSTLTSSQNRSMTNLRVLLAANAVSNGSK
jgi:hypothetical protein